MLKVILAFLCQVTVSCESLALNLMDHLPNRQLHVNNRNNRTRCEICLKLTIKTPERRHLRRSGAVIVNFAHISHC